MKPFKMHGNGSTIIQHASKWTLISGIAVAVIAFAIILFVTFSVFFSFGCFQYPYCSKEQHEEEGFKILLWSIATPLFWVALGITIVPFIVRISVRGR